MLWACISLRSRMSMKTWQMEVEPVGEGLNNDLIIIWVLSKWTLMVKWMAEKCAHNTTAWHEGTKHLQTIKRIWDGSKIRTSNLLGASLIWRPLEHDTNNDLMWNKNEYRSGTKMVRNILMVTHLFHAERKNGFKLAIW